MQDSEHSLRSYDSYLASAEREINVDQGKTDSDDIEKGHVRGSNEKKKIRDPFGNEEGSAVKYKEMKWWSVLSTLSSEPVQ